MGRMMAGRDGWRGAHPPDGTTPRPRSIGASYPPSDPTAGAEERSGSPADASARAADRAWSGGGARELRLGGHGDLVRGDRDLELDLLADEPAALLERDVPVEAPLGADELRRGGQAGVP